LLKVFEMSLNNVWLATQRQVYAELNRLADTGLVAVLTEGPRGRKEYGINDAGRAELHHWLIDVEPKQTARSDLLLRVFFLDQVDPAEAGAYLERRAAEAVQKHDELLALDKTVSAGTEPLAVYGRLALEWGLGSRPRNASGRGGPPSSSRP
jgi:PadR family transcriptional regulator AphA